MKRPLVPVALCYAAGVVLGHFVAAPLLACFIVSAVLILAVLVVSNLRGLDLRPGAIASHAEYGSGTGASKSVERPTEQSLWRSSPSARLPDYGVLILAVSLFLFGWINMTTRTEIISPYDLRTLLNDAEVVLLRGRIVDMPNQRVHFRNGLESSRTLAEIDVASIQLRHKEWQPAFGRVMTRTPGVLPAEFVNGQAVEVSGAALLPAPPIAAGVFDYRHYLNSRGIYYELKPDSIGEWKIYGDRIATPLTERFRKWAQATLARGLPEQDEPLRLQWAMLLGWRTALTAEVSEPFMNSGTMHIFAISGLHIALIAGIFVALFRAAMLPQVLCGLLVIPLIWFYTAATGWQASAIRSTVMMTIILLGWALKRPNDLLNSLAAAACIILVWQPEQLFQASFQLSFFVVLSIALFQPWIIKWKPKVLVPDPLVPDAVRPFWQCAAVRAGNVVWISFATSFAALLGSMPLIACYFHLWTPGGLLANLLIVPVASLALMSGLGAIICGDFVPPLTECFNHSGWFFMSAMIWMSETTSNLNWLWYFIRAPGSLFLVLYYGLLFAPCTGWLARPRWRWPATGCAAVLAVCWLIDWREQRSWHRLTVLPLNGGHAVYIQPARGASDWLIDTGNQGAVEFTVKPFLQAQGVNRLDHLLLTQGDTRQIGGASYLRDIFPVRAACASPINFRSSSYREVLADLEKKSRLHKFATNGMILPPWTVLHPDSLDRFAAANDNAIVALGTFDGVRVLLVSNLGRAGQNAVFNRHPELRADIVVAGLPAQGEPLATEWLAVLQPKLIVIADSEVPAARRATPALAARLRRSGWHTLFTRQTGAVTLSLRDSSWRVETAFDNPVVEP